MKRRWEIVWICTLDFFQLRFEAGELIGQHGLEQRNLARKMGVERFLADRELSRQVVHGHAAEAVAKEVCSRRLHDPLPTGIGCLVPPQELAPVFHIWNSLILHYRNYISIFSFQNQEKCSNKISITCPTQQTLKA